MLTMAIVRSKFQNMTHEEFKEWAESFVSHFNFMSQRLPKPYKIDFTSALVEGNGSLTTQHVKFHYMSVDGIGRREFYVQSVSIPAGAKFGSEDDWTQLMQLTLIDFMTFGASKMVQDEHERGGR